MSRYRVMVWEPGCRPTSFVRIVDRDIVPLDTRAQARERAAELRRRYPERRVWLERIPQCRRRSWLSRHYGLWQLDVWRMKHPWVFPWRPR